jgi:hypothetical protein
MKRKVILKLSYFWHLLAHFIYLNPNRRLCLRNAVEIVNEFQLKTIGKKAGSRTYTLSLTPSHHFHQMRSSMRALE